MLDLILKRISLSVILYLLPYLRLTALTLPALDPLRNPPRTPSRRTGAFSSAHTHHLLLTEFRLHLWQSHKQKPRSRLRSVSTSASSASTTPSQHPFDADKDFDISYIVSGLALNLNNNAKADDDTYASELDFVRRVSGTGTRIGSSSRGTGRGTGSGYGARDGPSGLNSTNPGTKIGSGKSLGWGDDPAVRIPSITPRRARARAATTTSASPSVYSMRKPMTISTSTGPVLERDTTGTATTKAASMVAPVAVTTITSERGTADDGGDATMLQSNSGASIPSPSAPSSSNLPPKPDSPSSLSSSTSLPFSPAPILNAEQLDITSLIEDNSINSMNGIPRTQMDTVKRKKSGVLSGLGIGGLGVLGVGSSKAARSSASLLSSASARTSSPSPGSPSRMGGASVSVSFGTEDDGHESSSSLSLSSSSLSSLSLPAAVATGAVPISTTGLASTEESEKVGLSTPSSDASPSSKAPQPLTISTHLVPTPKPNTDMNASSSGETPISTVMTAPVSSLVPTSITTSRTYPRPSSITSLQSSNSTPFTYDDSFARGLMAWSGPEYGDKRKEWVIRKERMKGGGNGKGRANGVREGTENRKDKESGKHTDNIDKPWEGLPPGTEEVWGNFLLGRFNVSREDVYPRNQRSGLAESGGAESTNTDPHQASEGQGTSGDVNAKALGKSKRGGSAREAEILGLRVPVGKPPQHRLIIKRLRDDQDRLTQPSTGNRWRGQSGPSSGGRRTITTVGENTAMEVDAHGKRNYSLLDSNTTSSSAPQIKRPIAAQESSPQSRNPRVVPTSGESISVTRDANLTLSTQLS
ncbi:hypothetical protein BT96DRAFT_71519 [Gymnopus androsaceus JB14]|uniref:Uncharacterized protein n=1 Tax=Gymnopus androsaceus JB14 TaxID=1447944 RepID=A0A6A4HKY9_9AGAR|nr:hypothetical protein BT96DRAFT_71519 [Gymnopus androsaceus JB14]